MRWFRRRERTTRVVVGLGLLTAVCAGCANEPVSSAPPVAPSATSSPVPSSTAPSTTAPPTSPVPAAADGNDVSACRDGTCEIEVTAPTDVPLSTFGIRRWRVGPSGPDGISFDLRPGGGNIRSGPQGRLSGSSGDTSTEGTVSGRGATITKRGVVMTLVAGDGRRTVLRFAQE